MMWVRRCVKNSALKYYRIWLIHHLGFCSVASTPVLIAVDLLLDGHSSIVDHIFRDALVEDDGIR